jgi:hypothetical protein
MDISCAKLVGGVAVLLTAMGYGYKIRVDRKTIKLEKNDKKGEQDHKKNAERIKQLEAKNGAGQHQIDELKEEVGELKNIIKKYQKNCQKHE